MWHFFSSTCFSELKVQFWQHWCPNTDLCYLLCSGYHSLQYDWTQHQLQPMISWIWQGEGDSHTDVIAWRDTRRGGGGRAVLLSEPSADRGDISVMTSVTDAKLTSNREILLWLPVTLLNIDPTLQQLQQWTKTASLYHLRSNLSCHLSKVS